MTEEEDGWPGPERLTEIRRLAGSLSLTLPGCLRACTHGGILLRAEGDHNLTLAATDMEISIRASLRGEIAGDAHVGRGGARP
jgi:hypothetical protein